MLNSLTLVLNFGDLVAKLCPTLVTPWTVSRKAPLSMGFSRQEYWSGLPLPSLGDLPYPGIEPWSPELKADFLLTELSEALVLHFTSSYLIKLNILFCFYFGHLPGYNIKILQSNCDLTLWKGILFLPHVKMKYFWAVVILLYLYWYLYFDKNDVCLIISTQ